MSELPSSANARTNPAVTPGSMDYGYTSEQPHHTDSYLFPTVLATLQRLSPGKPIFELGCGNGSTAAKLVEAGYSVTGIDPSESGIAIAARAFPRCRLEVGSSDEDLAARFGTFEVVLSLEVAEHVYSPKRYAEAIADLLQPGGVAIISTPYHAYLKNLALAVSGKMDGHFTALWEGGHIKFWSRQTLGALFDAAGFDEIGFERVGRFAPLAKSMVAIYRKRAGCAQ